MKPAASCWALDIETLGCLPRESSAASIPAITCVCLYDGATEHALAFYSVSEAVHRTNLDTLLQVLDAADILVGFNAISFDLEYIRRFFAIAFDRFEKWVAKTVDPYHFIKTHLGFTCGLGVLLAMNRLPSKSASGLIAIVWAKQGHMDWVLDYCMMDTKLTHALCCSPGASLRINDFWLASWRFTGFDTDSSPCSSIGRSKTLIEWSTQRVAAPLVVPCAPCFISTESLLASGGVCIRHDP